MSSRNKLRNLGVAALGVALLVVACGDDDDSPGQNTAGKAGSGTGGKNTAGSETGGDAGEIAGGKNAGGKAGSQTGGSATGGKAGSDAGGKAGNDAGGKAGNDAGGKAGNDAGGKGGNAGNAGTSGSSMGGGGMGGDAMGGGGMGGEGGEAGSAADPYAACRSCGATACVNPTVACNSVDLSVKCNALLDCIYRTGCAKDSLQDGRECYCGPGVDSDTCFNTTDVNVPQGVCKAETIAAAGSDVPSVVGQNFFKLTAAVGAAYQVVSCELSDETCGPICGLLSP